MKAAVLARILTIFVLGLSLAAEASRPDPQRENAIRLLREAAVNIDQMAPALRSPALNLLAEAWQPIAPGETRKILDQSFLAASALPAQEQGEQQAEVVLRIAATDLSTARELAGQIRTPSGEDYTTQTDWRAHAWDGLLQQSLAHEGFAKSLQQAKLMSDGLGDTTALCSLVRAAVHQGDPQSARDLVSLAAQQFPRRPITLQRFTSFPNALLLLASIDRPMASRLFDIAFSSLPEPPSPGDATTDAGKQRTAFRRDAARVLVRKAAAFDPLLAQAWTARLGATLLADEVDEPTETADAADPVPATSAAQNQPLAERVSASLSAIENPGLRARTTLRLARSFSRTDPMLAGDLLNAGRAEAAATTDPAQRASLYAKSARAAERLHEPRAAEDLESADAALAIAQRDAKDEETRSILIGAEMRLMPRILETLDPSAAELRAQQFTNPIVRFRALLLVAHRWSAASRLSQR